MKKIYINLLMLFVTAIAVAQINENNKLPIFAPASPKSYEFLKFGEIPVGKYTGVSNISVPIYTISSKGLDIPISLNYHSNGFKVNEEAGWTGLGWSLNGGGAIVQIVNSFDDFENPFSNRSMPDFGELVDIQCAGGCPSGSTIVNNCETFLLGNDLRLNHEPFYLAGVPGYYVIPNEFIHGTKDYEPDLFKFSMAGYSGEFLLDWKNEKFVCITDNKMKILPSSNYTGPGTIPNEFTIIVPEGHAFTFTLKEVTTVVNNGTRSLTRPNVPSMAPDMQSKTSSRSYQLSKIITNQSDLIEYEYLMTDPLQNYTTISKSIVRYVGNPTFPFPPEMDEDYLSFSNTRQSYSYIKKISFTGGTVDFITSDRIDIVGAKKLDRIEVKTAITPTQVLKNFDFQYSYFIGHTNGTNSDADLVSYGNSLNKTPQELTHRLKLLSVNETGNKPYRFEYNEGLLPKKTSLATDYWGYYNGVLTNATPFINVYAFGVDRKNQLFAAHENNEKGSRLEFTKAAILEKIIYPTGGFSTFDYELNSFSNSEIPPFAPYTQVVNSINSRPASGLLQRKAVLVKHDNMRFLINAQLSTRGCTTADLAGGANANTYVKIERFKKEIIPLVENVGSSLEYALVSIGIYTNPTVYNQYIDEVIYIRKLDSETEKIFSDLEYFFNKGVVLISASGGCGNYNGTVNSSQAHSVITYQEYKPIEPIYNGCGLRVKTIQSYTDSGASSLKKEFVYKGGKKMSPLNFYLSTYIPDYAYIGDGSYKQAIGYKNVLNSNTFTPLSSSAAGKYIGYDQVEEIFVSSQPAAPVSNIGKTIETYTNNYDTGAVARLYFPGSKKIVENGLLLKQEIFDNSNRRIEKNTNLYGFDKLDCFYGIRQDLYSKYKHVEANVISIYTKWQVGVYPLVSSRTYLKHSSNTKYFNNDSIVYKIDFEYNSLNQKIYSKNTGSNNDIIETYYYYPKELASDPSYPVATQMLASNVLSPILKMQLKTNGDIISTESFSYYMRLGSNNAYWRPDIYSLSKYGNSKGINGIENKINYHQYDNLGNPLDISMEDNVRICYIWGYGKKYPIAKIENIEYSQISSLALNLQNTSDTGDEVSLQLALSALRNNPILQNSMVTTYTYKPLVGVTSITDPKGIKTTYEYDTLGRLKAVRDHDGKLLSENEYNYR